jgi:ATP-binding cassette subfamily B protein
MYRFNRDNQEALGKMSDRVLASLAGVRVVRSFALEASEAAAFEKTNQYYLEKSVDLAKLRGSMGPMMGWISSMGMLIVFWYGGSLVLRGASPGRCSRSASSSRSSSAAAPATRGWR